MANKQKKFKIKDSDFETMDTTDRLIRDHNYQAMVLGNELNRKKLRLVEEFDPELAEKWKKGFVDVGVDWKKREMVVSPTLDPKKKAEEVAYEIGKSKNGVTEKTDTIN